jgi:heme/copper-type cytochrome/quinol oxidase subunit 3
LLACGLALLCALTQSAELIGRASAGARPADHVLIASWFTLVVAHMLHVAAGAVLMAWIARQIGTGDAPRLSARLYAVRLYWYFVVLTWIVLLITFSV